LQFAAEAANVADRFAAIRPPISLSLSLSVSLSLSLYIYIFIFIYVQPASGNWGLCFGESGPSTTTLYIKDATKIREDENREWKQSNSDDAATITLLQQSANVLKSFYKKNFAMVQANIVC